VPLGDGGGFEALRIEAGMPRMGAELDERTMPHETGLVARTVSFTKGCYTGQELVARVDSRGGHAPRHLRGVVMGTGTPVPPVGAVVEVDGREVGRLTSVAESPGLGTAVALALVRREVAPPAPARARWDGGNAVAEVRDLPLLS
ncbi:MAG: YgfZ/GcvT domain-containing protein, partial [Acidimicrobiales bacterium]